MKNVLLKSNRKTWKSNEPEFNDRWCVWPNLPFCVSIATVVILPYCLCHIACVKATLFVLQKNIIILIMSLLLNRCVDSMHSLNIEICTDRLIVCKTSILNEAFSSTLYTLHELLTMRVLYHSL